MTFELLKKSVDAPENSYPVIVSCRVRLSAARFVAATLLRMPDKSISKSVEDGREYLGIGMLECTGKRHSGSESVF